jgi:hypothetical protein
MKAPLVFSRTRWRTLRASQDRLNKDIVALMDKHGIAGVLNRIDEIDHQLFVPKKNKPGAPPKWKDGAVLYAWLEVEIQLQLAKLKNPRATLLPVMEVFFRKRMGMPLTVGDGLEIEDRKTACRLHSEGKKQLAANPRLAAKWHGMVARVVAGSRPREVARNYPRPK